MILRSKIPEYSYKAVARSNNVSVNKLCSRPKSVHILACFNNTPFSSALIGDAQGEGVPLLIFIVVLGIHIFYEQKRIVLQ